MIYQTSQAKIIRYVSLIDQAFPISSTFVLKSYLPTFCMGLHGPWGVKVVEWQPQTGRCYGGRPLFYGLKHCKGGGEKIIKAARLA